MADARVRLGMVGGGQGAFIGGVHRIAARIDDRYELVAGALSSKPDVAKASADELHIAPDRSYASYEEMFAAEAKREDGIEAVAIVTPNHMHFPVAKAALEAGINVICDKPVTRTLEEALELEQICAKSDAFFALTHNYSAYPLVRYAREMVERGDLGQVRLVQVEYPQEWLTQAPEEDNKQAAWRTDPKRSGKAGCLGDIGTHAFQLATFISQLELDSVSADLTAFVPGRAVDDNVHAMMRFKGGAKGMLWTSQIAPGCENGLKIRIFGDKAGLEWAQEKPNELWLTPLAGHHQRITRRDDNIDSDIATRGIRIPFGHPEGYLEAFATLYTDVADVLVAKRKGEQHPIESWIPGIETGVLGMRFIEAVLNSSEADGRWTPLVS
ncbi:MULTISPECIES: Gfo/Idh/MocA family protein [Marinimicrobium]|uniref:Putative dehydrogenase n=1 Tax=Marinimicrobium koreense TaxID=306545 RepID=A0A3N1NQL8_9GAMM|nr:MULTISPECIES: Gfo/Idh/MocA family oxidoreductase [Marinimicrobium]MAN50594.1 oxidoreductase [Marinimicrobium sp.]ROQ21132.1 putative dehydrogenase [Marinimicrobium koreense]|tara:strand:+ start:250 stop:1401 length:1152 start_codon:yes stop_codon:yes gene_type:complete